MTLAGHPPVTTISKNEGSTRNAVFCVFSSCWFRVSQAITLLLAFLSCLVGGCILFPIFHNNTRFGKTYFRCFLFYSLALLLCNVYGVVHTTVPSEDTLVTHQVRFQC